MQITKQEKGDLNLTLSLVIEPEDYRDQYKKSINELAKNAKIQGFRPGKVPPGLIRKMYGESVLADELQKVLNKELSQYLQENKIDILGDPLPANEAEKNALDPQNEKSYTFIYDLGLQPDVQLTPVEKHSKITRYKVKLDDKLVEEEVQRLRKRYGKMEPGEVIGPDDVVLAEWHGKELDGHEFVHESAFAVSRLKDEKKRKTIMKLKVGDTYSLDPLKDFDLSRKEAAEQLFHKKPEEIEAAGPKLKFEIKKIHNLHPAELTEEFFKKFYGEEVKTEEAFRDKVREELVLQLANESDYHLKKDIADLIIDRSKIPLPEAFLKRYLMEHGDKALSDEELEKEFDPFIRGLKWQLIVNKIMKDAEIKVEMEEVANHTRQQLAMQYGFNLNDETLAPQIDSVVNNLLENKEHVQKTAENIRDEEVFGYLINALDVKDKEVSRKKFEELMHPDGHHH